MVLGRWETGRQHADRKTERQEIGRQAGRWKQEQGDGDTGRWKTGDRRWEMEDRETDGMQKTGRKEDWETRRQEDWIQ